MSRRPGSRALPGILLVGAVFPLAALAQVHHLDEAPWYAAADSASRRGAAFTWDQSRDPDTGWRADRLGLSVLVPIGRRGVLFAREDYLRFDTAGYSVFERWPHLRAVDAEDPDATDPAWPHESMIAGFGRPELGLLMPLRLPLAGPGCLGVQAGLPFGRDELYPFSASCLPLRFDWRRPVALGGGVAGALRGGYEATFGANGKELARDAYPDGWRYGIELGTDLARGRGLTIGWSARELTDGHHVRRLQATGWWQLADGHAIQLQVTRDLGGQADRYAAWIVGLGWRLAGLRAAAPSASPAPTQTATPPSRPTRP